jgi:membrane-bound lytic murein transglycosylase A
VVRGSLVRTKAYPIPLRRAPDDLVSLSPGSVAGFDPTLSAGRRGPDGRLVAMPDRAGIEAGALDGVAPALAYVASPVDAFLIQVQGSARLALPDGRLKRLVFAGRNGYPYTSIGRSLVTRLHIPPEAMGMTELRRWIETHGQTGDGAGAKLMRENRSYIFFRFDDSLGDRAGPIGGAGLSLTGGRSLAIDRTLWPYGLPFYVATDLPNGTAFRHLMVAQDTGAAIKGPARADIFFGSGQRAARLSGPMRQTGQLFVLWPRVRGDGDHRP